MRRTLTALFFTSALLSVTACPQEKKDLLALPAAYNPVEAGLTFNKKGLEAFNLLDADARKQFVKALKDQPGSFRGQAIFQAGNGLGAAVEDSQHGAYEVFAHVPDPVLYEITINYQIFTTPELGKPLAPNAAIKFSGTVVDVRYDAEKKPRLLTIRVKADSLETITDKTPVAASAPAAAPAPAP